jgi:hypothetical protein
MNTLGTNSKSSRPARSDDIEIKIYQDDDLKEILCEGHGSWLSHLILDDKEVWRIEEKENQVNWKEFGDFSNGMKSLSSDSS